MRLSRREVLAALAGAAVASKPGAAAVRDPVSLWRGGAVYGAGQCGSSRLITRGWTRGEVLDVGDVFTIEGVHQIDWPSLRPMEGLKRFVVTQRVVCAGGAVTLPFWPPLIPRGYFMNCSGSPRHGAAIERARPGRVAPGVMRCASYVSRSSSVGARCR